ncbi:MAG: hypothetical protein EOP45_10600 [Sphingobacteriaceae bacterium]|nr:MAG: hypothetical protein EOP45_10600 [Sphingobacteriaceae bacterium]
MMPRIDWRSGNYILVMIQCCCLELIGIKTPNRKLLLGNTEYEVEHISTYFELIRQMITYFLFIFYNKSLLLFFLVASSDRVG